MAHLDCDLLVIGGGPGGYSAAFRAADLGLRVILVEERPTLGGVCLNVGCIPSKAYLHQAAMIREAANALLAGIDFGLPRIDTEAMRRGKDETVAKLTAGLSGLASARRVTVVKGAASFVDLGSAEVIGNPEVAGIAFRASVVAVGTAPARLIELPPDPRVLDSTSALELPGATGSMLIVGGGIIGLEMATIYAALGVEIDIVELTPDLMPGTDRELVKVWEKANASQIRDVFRKCRIVDATAKKKGIEVTFAGPNAPAGPKVYEFVLCAIGRTSNSASVRPDLIGLKIDERGFVLVDPQMRTNISNIFAIGDVVGAPMLAHKAVHQGHVAAEVIAGELLGDLHLSRVAFDARVIPAVSYTYPEVAWVGMTELAAREQGRDIRVAKFPWSASGRALANGCEYGLTKLITDPLTQEIIGGALVGPGAGEMISEIALAIEMGAVARDIALTIHPHPTLAETIGLAAETVDGSCTDLPPPKTKGAGR